LPKRFVIDSEIHYVTAELNAGCINYKNNFVFTATALSLLATWGIADNICKASTYTNTSLRNYMQTKDFIMSVVFSYIQLKVIRAAALQQNNKRAK
jgi:hypothetical protein